MDVLAKIDSFYNEFQGNKFSIGKSVLGRKIPCFQMGEGFPVVIVQYAIHAREWLTALLALEQIKNFCARGTFYFVPVANPDGVALATKGLSCVSAARAEYLLSINKSRTDFSLWKANANGVDLNVNFDAEWGKGARNVFLPASENYVGEHPHSEPEVRALVEFTMRVRPNATLSYHTKGEEIYWFFDQCGQACERDFTIARALAAATGYTAKYTPASVGGYKDWCVRTLGIPAFTIEAGADSLSHPLKEESLARIAAQNANALRALSEELIWMKK